MDENKKAKKNNIGLIIIGLGIIFICFGLVFSINNGSRGNSNQEENDNKENNTENNNNQDNDNDIDYDTDNDGERKEIELNDEIMTLYLKYQSLDYPVELSNNKIESKIYDVEIFKISSLNNYLPDDYGNKIVEEAVFDFNSNNGDIEDISEYKKIIFEKIEKKFLEFFGKNVKYNNNLFDNYEFVEKDGIVTFKNNNVDGGSSKSAQYNTIKVEKDNKNIYLYEDVFVTDDSTNDVINYVYRWVYRLQDDGKYYLLKVERIKYQDYYIIENKENIISKFSSIILDYSSVYNKDKYDINDISFNELLVTVLSKMELCKEGNNKKISIELLNERLKPFFKNKLTIEDIKNQFKDGKLNVKIGNNSKYDYDIVLNNDNTLNVSNKKCNDTTVVKELIRTHITNIEKNNNTIIIYEKTAFGKYNETQKDDHGSYIIDYYYDYDKSGKVLESLSLNNSKEPNWDLYKTYKYTFELENGIYYFQTIELV